MSTEVTNTMEQAPAQQEQGQESARAPPSTARSPTFARRTKASSSRSRCPVSARRMSICSNAKS